MRIIVDRIEGDIAVCELESGEMRDIALTDLPVGVHDGSILLFENNTYTLDKETEAQRREKLFALQNSIFDE